MTQKNFKTVVETLRANFSKPENIVKVYLNNGTVFDYDIGSFLEFNEKEIEFESSMAGCNSRKGICFFEVASITAVGVILK